MALTKEEIARLYQRRASWYNFSANTYYLIGQREYAYRKMAVGELRLQPGEAVD